MSDRTSQLDEHDELMSMLPWYVNQTLDVRDQEIVSRHVESCDECQNEVSFLTSLNSVVQTDAQIAFASRADTDKSLTSVMARIDAQEPTRSVTAPTPSNLMQRLSDLLTSALSPPLAQWGATVMAGLLVAVLGFQMFYSQPEDDYSVLSSSESGDALLRLSIELAPEENWSTTQALIQAEFDKTGQQLVFDSRADGGYIILVEQDMGVEALSKLVVELEALDSVVSVGIVP